MIICFKIMYTYGVKYTYSYNMDIHSVCVPCVSRIHSVCVHSQTYMRTHTQTYSYKSCAFISCIYVPLFHVYVFLVYPPCVYRVCMLLHIHTPRHICVHTPRHMVINHVPLFHVYVFLVYPQCVYRVCMLFHIHTPRHASRCVIYNYMSRCVYA